MTSGAGLACSAVTVADVLGILGFLLALFLAALQVRSAMTRVRVEVSHSEERDPSERVVIEDYLSIRVVNLSAHPVTVVDFTYARSGQERTGWQSWRVGRAHGLPADLPPHGGHVDMHLHEETLDDRLGERPFEGPITAWVKLSTGRVFKSKTRSKSN
jgi:hypothetical protein